MPNSKGIGNILEIVHGIMIGSRDIEISSTKGKTSWRL